jgi:hypothetical protein
MNLLRNFMIHAVRKYSNSKLSAALHPHSVRLLVSGSQVIKQLPLIKIFDKQELEVSLPIVLLELTKAKIWDLRGKHVVSSTL